MKISSVILPLAAALVISTVGALSAESVKSAKPAKSAKGVEAVAKSETPAPERIEIPRSEFVIPTSPMEGRDPFYPDSTRMFAMAAKTASKGAAKPAPSVQFQLKAISTSGGRRVASINNRPFETNEEGELAFGSARIRIRCVEIRDDSVLIEVDGQPHELRLRPGF